MYVILFIFAREDGGEPGERSGTQPVTHEAGG